ncbi:unnamed protein product [Penicillium salamii]|uniref:Uncharacterized protein n=1 Tax=Penicillium salamii TaxID=1612424 RepID=A0A9W4NUU5_9EURO|nr:unnamed protein product [Penicillium salamii]CAG8326245.1 unnamed protein product [Penicillium salamii]CAG8348116.1 unnamed protein product [Penicillium salamii]CAG8404386.1 unnamed protein product [Penicillium salamii]CAG8412574.1 unnamed protein product [Penicillium salamii]
MFRDVKDPVTSVKAKSTDEVSRRLWAPFFLRRPIMVVFLISYLACLGALIALYVYTQRQNHTLGIRTDGERLYYLWTYGPTAVFTILTAGWLQAEYRAAQLMPWILMRRGPTAASQSIFLDYLSKWNVMSLFESLKQRHFLVSLCVAGSLLLNGVTVFSTGLFELDSVLLTESTDMTVTSKFGETGFNPLTKNAKAFAACMAFSNRNMTPPAGIHGKYTYTPFQPAALESTRNSTIPADRTYQAEIEVIRPYFDCQNATISWELSTARFTDNETAVYTAPDGCRYQTRETPSVLLNSDTNFGINAEIYGCQGQRLNDTDSSDPPYINDWDIDFRIWASIAPSQTHNLTVQQQLTYADYKKDPFRVVVCKPQYTAYQGPVRIWREAGGSANSVDIQPDTLNVTKGITGVQAAKLMYSSLKSASTGYSTTGEPSGYQYVFAANGTSWDKLWADTSAFEHAVADSFSCMMQQVLKNDLLQDEPHNIKGTMQLTEDRLFVRQMSFWLMVVLLGMLIATVVMLLCLFVPVAVCPRDTGSIGGLATVLAQSPELMTSFEGSQLKTEMQMAACRPGQTQYTTIADIAGTFAIVPQDQPVSRSIEPSDGEDTPQWWHPFASTWFVRITVVVLPIAVIVSLEVAYHISTSRRGITVVDGKSPYIHYIWVYIPALIMFAIRCLFTSVEFGTRIVQPYSTLRKGSAPPETTILENQLRKIAVYGVVDTLRKKQWALAAATIALLLAAINPILVSGLFTAKVSGPTFPMNLTQSTRWDLGNPTNASLIMRYYSEQGYNTDHTAGLILNLNLTDPQWTYNNLAFPQFSLASNNSYDEGYIDVRVPALRSRLACAEAPANTCEYIRGKLWCESKTNSTCFFETSTSTVADVDYFLEAPIQSTKNTGLAVCPTFSILFGKYSNSNHTKASEYQYLYCNATLEEVDVDTRLQLPSLSIDTDTPPRVQESSARQPFNTNARSFPSFDLLRSSYLFKSDPKYNNALLETLVQGIDGVPLSELLAPEKLIARLEVVYGVTVAQLLNTGARSSFSEPYNKTYFVDPATMTAPTYTGIFHDGRKYLVQNMISTRILDGVLGSMVVCAVIALCAMRTTKILPKSPTSIASVASFLYGSRLLGSVLPRGAEWWSDGDLKRRVFEGRSFSMGFWEKNDRHRDSDVSSVSDVDVSEMHEPMDRSTSRTRFGIDVDFERRM